MPGAEIAGTDDHSGLEGSGGRFEGCGATRDMDTIGPEAAGEGNLDVLFLLGADDSGTAFKVPTDTVLAEGEYLKPDLSGQ